MCQTSSTFGFATATYRHTISKDYLDSLVTRSLRRLCIMYHWHLKSTCGWMLEPTTNESTGKLFSKKIIYAFDLGFERDIDCFVYEFLSRSMNIVAKHDLLQPTTPYSRNWSEQVRIEQTTDDGQEHSSLQSPSSCSHPSLRTWSFWTWDTIKVLYS